MTGKRNVMAKRSIEINGEIFIYNLKKNKRSKGIKITVYPDGSFLVTKPWFASDKIAESFVRKKSDWIVSQVDKYKERGSEFMLGGSREDYLRNKTKALKFIKDRVDFFNRAYGLKMNRISIRNQKTRWGSCSQRGNLNFNYKVASLPQDLADYVIVHELCHLKEMNHSKKFWDLVSEVLPNHRDLRRRLKRRNG